MSGAAIRQAFLDFYASHPELNHTLLPSSSLVPEDPTVLLTIAGMLQFKPIFLGQISAQETINTTRATTSQKCVRTNDIENVGVTARHHTFFEMLGNFSFGDYFKEQACFMAWQLSTEVYNIPPSRIHVSVFETDDEAYAIWTEKVGVDKRHVHRLGADDNFWAAGPTGPCGPCTELYYDFAPENGYDAIDLANDDDRFLEFYNLVFMEMNRAADGSTTPLERKCIDTGMGLERMAQVLQGVDNNYETDLLFPIIETMVQLMPSSSGDDMRAVYTTLDETTQRYLKVIADHTRASINLLSDGVLPSNVGRGYVLRRLIRRTVRCCRLIGVDASKAVEAAAETAFSLTGAAPGLEIPDPKKVQKELGKEVARFLETLDRGETLLMDVIAKAKADGADKISGNDAFVLYDTFGFPVDITSEVAAEHGLTVDMAGFEEEMEAQKSRSRKAVSAVDVTAAGAFGAVLESNGSTDFVGYEEVEAAGATVVGVFEVAEEDQEAMKANLKGSKKEKKQKVAKEEKEDSKQKAATGPPTKFKVVLDRTPFYAESGGQVGDRGLLMINNARWRVLDCQKAASGQLHVHDVTFDGLLGEPSVEKPTPPPASAQLEVGMVVDAAAVDATARRRITAHHSATHLLQSALKSVLGDELKQAGSYCDASRLRFDFSGPSVDGPLTPEQLAEVEALVNSWTTGSALPRTAREMPIKEASEMGATMAFGEKYGDVVRVVDFGQGVSVELCGGCHVENTAQIGLFRIVAETGIAAGVRRIEAVVGESAYEYLSTRDNTFSQVCGMLAAQPDEVVSRVGSMQKDSVSLNKELAALKEKMAELEASRILSESVTEAGNGAYVAASMDGTPAAALQTAAKFLLESVEAKLGGGDDDEPKPVCILLSSVLAAEEKLAFACAANDAAVKDRGLNAGKLVGAVAKVAGGGGGGKPNLAQAGGRDITKAGEALEKAREELAAAFDDQ